MLLLVLSSTPWPTDEDDIIATEHPQRLTWADDDPLPANLIGTGRCQRDQGEAGGGVDGRYDASDGRARAAGRAEHAEPHPSPLQALVVSANNLHLRALWAISDNKPTVDHDATLDVPCYAREPWPKRRVERIVSCRVNLMRRATDGLSDKRG
jgi:hypothetical protein